jgi:predicted DCC family thiol-disulfide oxidoreductase YuxK
MTRPKLPERLAIFDGVCNLCDGAVKFIIAHDRKRKFMFTPLQSAAGQEVLAAHDLPTESFESFIYLRNGKLYQRSTAALYVLKDIGGLWALFYVFIIVPGFFRNWIYDVIARSRTAISLAKRTHAWYPQRR